jgi:hypothetical protein
MGLKELQALKAAKTGSVMNVEQAREYFKGMKTGANPMQGKFNSGTYETAKGQMYFRSKWEANYALYLDWLVKMGKKKDWEYESEVYKFGDIKSTYKIDFKVIDFDGTFELHEIKGSMTASARTKLKRMKKYHPNVKVILIEKKQYDGIIRSMKGIIKFY